LAKAWYNSVQYHVKYNSPQLLHEWDQTSPWSLTALKAVWQNDDICDYRLHHALTGWTQMNMHLTKIWPIYNFCRKHSSTFPSTCSHNAFNFNHVFHKNYENSHFYMSKFLTCVSKQASNTCTHTNKICNEVHVINFAKEKWSRNWQYKVLSHVFWPISFIRWT
jgi:hypothetical protein